MAKPVVRYRVDPDDPRAPPQDVWDQLSPEEREQIVASLPSEFPVSEANPPEGDWHFNAKVRAKSTLGSFFAKVKRPVYLACELPVYYPDERMFSPDVIAVVDVETHERETWVVGTEGKGIDVAIEVHVKGDRRKDLERNVERYARLGITEYFIFDRGRLRLSGYRLPSPSARAYQPILPQGGMYACQVLGLDLCIKDDRLRFFAGTASLLDADELVVSMENMLDKLEERARAAEERAEEETQRREAAERMREAAEQRREVEAQRREVAEQKHAEAERRLAAALAEIERLKAERSRR
jgi:Uma2 family endonuclease